MKDHRTNRATSSGADLRDYRLANEATVMLRRGGLLASVSARRALYAWIIRPSGSPASVVALALVTLLGPVACTGSPATLALRPDFEVKTLAGIDSVSIRESLPGMTESEFEQLVRMGMEHAAPGSVLPEPLEGPSPQCRIVCPANPTVGPAVSIRVSQPL